MDEATKMAQMNEWLDEVCAALDVDRDAISAVTPDILDLVADIAHGPSRPGGPLTAMAIGIAAAENPNGFEAGVDEGIAAVRELLGE